MTEKQAIIIDNGSDTCKVGYAEDIKPRSVFPSVVGHPKNPPDTKRVGDWAIDKKQFYFLKYPIDCGTITNWDDMEKIWEYGIYSQLRADPSEHPVVLTDPVMNEKHQREKMIKILFETFNVPSFYVAYQGVLSLFAAGRSTGIAVDIGNSISQYVPVYERISIQYASLKNKLGGRDIDTYLNKLLSDYAFPRADYIFGANQKEIVHDIKEKFCYVAVDYDAEIQKAETTSKCNESYVLPTDKIMSFDKERFTAPELLFKPQLNDLGFEGIDQNIVSCIKKCNADIHKDLFNNIVLSGGSSMFGGIQERLEKEISHRAPETMDVKVVAPKERKYGAFFGGSILASLPTFPLMAVTRDEYNDAGPGIVNRKCL